MINDWVRLSLLSQGLLFVYYQVIEWVNLFPWNDIRHGNGQSSLDLMVAAILAALLLASWRRYRWVMAIGVGLFGLWTWLQIDSWWVPYFRGASPGLESRIRPIFRSNGQSASLRHFAPLSRRVPHCSSSLTFNGARQHLHFYVSDVLKHKLPGCETVESAKMAINPHFKLARFFIRVEC